MPYGAYIPSCRGGHVARYRGTDYRARWGVQAFWELGEASGTRVDSYGGNNFTSNNSVGQAAGKVGNAAQLVAASSQYLSRADNASLSTGDVDFWVAAWAYLDTLGTIRAIAAKLNSTGGGEWDLRTLASDAPVFRIFNGGAQRGIATSATTLTLSTWHFVMGYHDSVNDAVGVSVNGGAWATGATSGAPADTAIALALGAHANAATFWDGRLDQAAFGKSPALGIAALKDEIRDTLYNGGAGRSYGQIAGWEP